MRTAPELYAPGVLSLAGLVGLPYSEANCRDLARMALERCGIPVAPYAFGDLGGVDTHEGELESYLERMGEEWVEVEAATKLGDVVVSSCAEEPFGPHVSVLVDEPGRLVLTTSQAHGSQAYPLGVIGAVRSALRWAGANG